MIRTQFGAQWIADRPADDGADPHDVVPFGRAWVVRDADRGRGLDALAWDIAGGQSRRPMKTGGPPKPLATTNARNLGLPQWRPLAEQPAQRCIIPLTQFFEWSPKAYPVEGGGARKGAMWFAVQDQPVFGVAGLWQETGDRPGFAMVTCEANELVAPVHPKAMMVILAEADWEAWLTGSYDEIIALQKPYPAHLMTVRGPLFATGKAS
jgi:putative SOS response-associated peptidase YedK